MGGVRSEVVGMALAPEESDSFHGGDHDDHGLRDESEGCGMEMLRQENLNLNLSLGNRGQSKVSSEALQVSALPYRTLIRFLRLFCFELLFLQVVGIHPYILTLVLFTASKCKTSACFGHPEGH